MKTKQTLSKIITFCMALVFTSLLPAQTIWRVNNQSNYNGTDNFGENYGGTPSFPVFKSINQAVNYPNVVDNDTIHVEGSTEIYPEAAITKKLTIIGPGYFLSENEKVSNNTLTADIENIEFNNGSQGSQLIGMSVVYNGSSADGIIYLNASNITIKRCFIARYIKFETNLSSAYILQNFFSERDSGLYSALRYNGSSSFIPPLEIIFNNNISKKKLIWSSNTWGIGTITECKNNVFDGPANELNLSFNTDSFQNNILKAAGITAEINSGTNNNVEYNTVSNSSVFEGTTGYLWVPSMALLFVDEGTTDGSYQLKPESEYNQAGSDGAERGAFGGIVVGNRYNLSGLGAIPVTYEVTTTGVAEPGTGLPISIKARTNY